MSDFLISIKPVHVKSILLGIKTVEVRRKQSRIKDGDRLWIYSTRPEARIVASAIVAGVDFDTRRRIWSKYAEMTAITKADYDLYTAKASQVFAIKLGALEMLARPVSLNELREVRSFHPPQYVCRLEVNDLILRMLERKKLIKKAA